MDPNNSRAKLAAELLACVRGDRAERGGDASLLARGAKSMKGSAYVGDPRSAKMPEGETAVAGHQKRDNRRFTYPVLRVLVGKSTYDTVDWSLGGLAVGNYVGDLKNGGRIQIVISDGGRSSAYYPAQARIIRADPRKRILSLQFSNLSRGGFDWLSGLQLMQSRRR
jgi:hypothetical protein